MKSKLEMNPVARRGTWDTGQGLDLLQALKGLGHDPGMGGLGILKEGRVGRDCWPVLTRGCPGSWLKGSPWDCQILGKDKEIGL